VLGGRGRPLGGEKVSEAQSLEPFLFQASQLDSVTALVVHLDQVRWPNVQERLEAPDPLLVEQLLLLLDPISSPVAVFSLVIGPEEEQV
jgi:predicted metal-dependent enzyme (double-stranded beta helix superfamily)